MDENVLEEIPAVESESECRENCRQKSNCSFFTFFQKDDPNSQTCVLLSHLMEPLQQCDYVLYVEEQKFNMFTYTGANEIDVLNSLSFGVSQFELRVLVTFVNIYPVF